jgi:GTP-binding protein YchF
MGVAGKLDVQVAVVDVPDPMLDTLNGMFNPPSKVNIKITYSDIGGLAKGISEGGLSGPFRNELAQMEGFLHVVRAFEDPSVPHPEETVDPQRDLDILDAEFLLNDLLTVENRIAKLQEEMQRGKDRAANAKELEVFEPLREALENERPLRDLNLTDAQRDSLRGYSFLTIKPKLVLVNTGDEARPAEEIVRVRGRQSAVLAIQGKLEMEIAQLEPDEAAEFMSEYGITEAMRDRVIRKSFDLLHIQTFYTVGEDECRAWTCPVGATAQQAAGRIHTDLERRFIKAEIISAETLIELGGLVQAKEVGKLRLEGRDYVMAQGDIINVKHNA